MKIIWRKKAYDSLEAIYNYIKLDSPQNAVMVFNKIYDLSQSLSVFPQKYPVDPSFNNPNIRFVVVWSYKITYIIETKSIVILKVFDMRQHPKKLKP